MFYPYGERTAGIRLSTAAERDEVLRSLAVFYRKFAICLALGATASLLLPVAFLLGAHFFFPEAYVDVRRTLFQNGDRISSVLVLAPLAYWLYDYRRFLKRVSTRFEKIPATIRPGRSNRALILAFLALIATLYFLPRFKQ